MHKDANDGGTKLATKCGRTPEFQPQAIRADSGAPVITMKIVARCPGGDILSSAQTRMPVTSNGPNVASATFDLSAKPIVIAPGPGGSQNTGDRQRRPSVRHQSARRPGGAAAEFEAARAGRDQDRLAQRRNGA